MGIKSTDHFSSPVVVGLWRWVIPICIVMVLVSQLTDIVPEVIPTVGILVVLIVTAAIILQRSLKDAKSHNASTFSKVGFILLYGSFIVSIMTLLFKILFHVPAAERSGG